MSVHFQRELARLRKSVLSVGARVEDAIDKAISALLTRDLSLAQRVMEHDGEIDQMEIEVEEQCLKIFALYQPVAHDLRFLVAVLKMNNDLERMGDHAANIAKRARYLAQRDPQPWPPELETLAHNSRKMVKQCLDALVTGNADLAREVCRFDEVVDEQKRMMTRGIRAALQDSPEYTDVFLKMMDVPRHLERIADLATNIAEDVIYITEGTIHRHHHLLSVDGDDEE